MDAGCFCVAGAALGAAQSHFGWQVQRSEHLSVILRGFQVCCPQSVDVVTKPPHSASAGQASSEASTSVDTLFQCMLCSSEHIRLNTDPGDQVRSSVFCQVTASTSDFPCAELSQGGV